MIVFVTETSKRNDRVYDRRGKRSDSVALFKVVDHPLLAGLQSFFSRRRPAVALQQLEGEISSVENRPPEPPSSRHVHGLAEHQLANVGFFRDRTIRFARPHPRKRNDDAASPRRHL